MLPSHSLLHEIAARREVAVADRKIRASLPEVLAKIQGLPAPRAFADAFRGPGVHIIAEIKRSSPSEGALAQNADPVAVANEYLKAGAAALSVLTEPEYFGGRVEFLSAIRSRFPESRLLMKDFIVDEYQIAEGRLFGADAVLLIAALLEGNKLERLFLFAKAMGLTPLVEVHDEAELTRALALGPALIGVNNRNLKTLEVSLDVSRRLAAQVPADRTLIAESGLKSANELKELSRLGYRGFLIGTSLMRTGSPGEALAKLLAGAA